MSRTFSPHTVRVTQNAETGVTFEAAPRFNMRYAYFRSSDSVANQIEGQDYLTFKYDDQQLAFAVCDGVGSSFCGNIAARVLGEGLLEWLWDLKADHLTSPDALSEAARAYLRKLQPEAQREVEAYEIADHLSPLVRQALEQQRAYGSEAIFVAGRLEHPSDDVPDGRLLLLWMGDTQAALYDDSGKALPLGGTWDNSDRWSSVQGVRGTAHSWLGGSSQIARLQVFTDGFAAYGDQLKTFSDLELEEALQAQFRLPTSDDVALIDVAQHTLMFMGLIAGDNPVDPELQKPDIAPVQNNGRDGDYEVQWTWTGNGKAKFELQEATNPAFGGAYSEEVGSDMAWQTQETRPPGRYYYRVRAISGRKGTTGPWSAPQSVRVAYPPPPAPALAEVGAPAEGAFAVAWNEVQHAQEYVLEEATQEDFADAKPVYRGRGNAWHTDGLHKPADYYYRVQATNDGGASAWSTTQRVKVIMPPPPVPTLAYLQAVAPDSPFTASWSDVAHATYYELQEKAEASRAEQLFKTEDSQYTLDPHPAGRYAYRVRACHEHACSEWSNTQIIEVLPAVPSDAPVLVIEGPDDSHMLRLTYEPVKHATSYTLEEATHADFRQAMAASLGDRDEHTLVRRDAGFYYYRLRGENRSGAGPWSDPVEVHIVPATPGWIDVNPADNRGGQVEIAWDPVWGQVRYEVELRTGETTPDGKWTDSKTVYAGAEPLCRVPVPKGMNLLEFRVRATHPDGAGGWQYADPLMLQTQLSAPDLHPVEYRGDGTVVISWQPVEGANQYQIEHARDAGFTAANIHETDRIRFVFRPIASQSWFRLRACDAYGCSDPSDPVEVTLETLPAPRIEPLARGENTPPVTVRWSAVPGATEYEVQEASDASFLTVERSVVSGNVPQYAVKARSAGQVYLRVQAIGAQDRRSQWSEVTIIKIG